MTQNQIPKDAKIAFDAETHLKRCESLALLCIDSYKLHDVDNTNKFCEMATDYMRQMVIRLRELRDNLNRHASNNDIDPPPFLK